MNSKFHPASYGGFVMGLGALVLALGACADHAADLGVACSGTGGDAGCRTEPENSTSSTGTGGDGAGGSATAGTTGSGGYASDVGNSGGAGGDGGAGAPLSPTCAGLDMVPRTVYMSADDSNSMGSPGHIREILHVGFEPNPVKIRTYEFLNYYRISYPAAGPDTLSIIPEMEITAEPTIADFQIAIRSFDAPTARRPMNFTFLIDTSGSMKGAGIERAKAAVHALASQFVAGDIVNMITTDSASVKLNGYTVTDKNDPMLLSTVDALTTGGNTELLSALSAAYDLADMYHDNKRMSRVVFISDGGANVGITDIDLLAQRSSDADDEGIYFVGIGTGPALSFNDKLMDAVTDAGRGAYVYLDSTAEATRILADRFDETMDIAARAVQVELTLPWYFKVDGVSTESPLSMEPVEPQHLAPNDAMVFFLKTTVCDPSLYDSEDLVTINVKWKSRQPYTNQLTQFKAPLKSLIGQNSPTMMKGRAIVAYAEALKGCGVDEKLEKSLCKSETERKKMTKEKLLEARDLATKAKNGMVDAELDEIIEIIGNHPLIK